MLNLKKQSFEDKSTPAKPVLTVIEKGKIVSVSGYRKLEVQPDKSLLAGLVGSMLIHVGLFAVGFYVWQSVAPNQPAKGDDQSQVFNVELISASEFASQVPSTEESLPEEVVPQKQLPTESPVAPVIEKTQSKKKKAVDNPKKIISETPIAANDGQASVGQSFGVSNGQGKVPPNYAQIIAARISANKTYPRRAKERGIEGRVVVSLTVSRSGELVDSHVVSTDSNLLSYGVEEIIRRSTPFPEIPTELNTSEVTLEVPIRFNLED